MSKHGVYVSFAVLIHSSALVLSCLLVGLAAVSLASIVLWLLLLFLLAGAVLSVLWLWSLRGGHSYGLWELEGEEERS